MTLFKVESQEDYFLVIASEDVTSPAGDVAGKKTTWDYPIFKAFFFLSYSKRLIIEIFRIEILNNLVVRQRP